MTNLFTIPGAPQGLIDIINTRRARIPAGLMMTATPPEPDPPADEPADAAAGADQASESGENPSAPPKDADEPLGTPGKKALEAERQARKALEEQLKALLPLKDQMEAIAGVFGKKPDEAPDMAATVAALQKQLDDMTAKQAHADMVASVVADHESLSAADVALVSQLSERDAMEKLAKRLAEGATPGLPKHDPSLGKGGNGQESRSTSVAQVMADRRTAREAKQKAT